MSNTGNDITTNKMVVNINSQNRNFTNNTVTDNLRIENLGSVINNNRTGTLYIPWTANPNNKLTAGNTAATITLAATHAAAILKNNIGTTISGTGVNTMRTGNIVNNINEENQSGTGIPTSVPTAYGQKFTYIIKKRFTKQAWTPVD
ncbi:MAG TPA: hypothetical protein VN722_01635 [Hanamia sp.]|nr:hypothetical protein [Hanamia sp.]